MPPLFFNKKIQNITVMSRKIQNYIFICLSFFMLTSCSSKSQKQGTAVEKAKLIELKKTNQKECLNDYIGKIEILKLYTDLNIVEISKVIFFRDNYYILDKKTSKLLVFNKEGYFLQKIGSRGQGPGEYTKLTEFEIDKKNNLLLLFSNWDSKLLKFDLKGNFISSFRLKNYPDSFILSTSGNYIFYTAFNNSNLNSVVYTDTKGTPIKYTFPFPKGRMNIGTGYTGGLHKQGFSNYFTEMTSSLIYELNKGVFVPKYQFDFGIFTWSEKDRYKIKEFFTKTNNYSYLQNYYCDTEKVLAFSFSHNKFLRRGFYFKETAHYIAAPYNVDYKDILYRLLYLPVGIKGSQFISGLDYELVKILSESNGNREKLRRMRPDFYNAIKDFKEEDNPYLVLYEIKDKK